MGRRTKGEGTIYKDNSRPENSRWIGEIFASGSRRRVYGRKKAEAKQKLDALVREISSGVVSGRGKTVGDILTLWLEDGLDDEKVNTATRAAYEWAVARLRNAEAGSRALERIKVAELSTPDVNSALRFIATAPEPRGRKTDKTRRRLSVDSLRKIRSVLSMALDYAVEQRMVGTNVAALAKIPVEAAAPIKRPALSVDNARRLADGLKDDPDGALWYVMLRTGLRFGEASALSVESFNGSTLNVWQSARRTYEAKEDGGYRSTLEVADELKNAASRRTLALPDDVIVVLEEHLEREADRIAQDRRRDRTPLLFPGANGGLLEPKGARKQLASICDRLGVYVVGPDKKRRPPTPHELRHTAATLLLYEAKESPLFVADVLGHADTRMVLRRYRDQDQRGARQVVGASDWL